MHTNERNAALPTGEFPRHAVVFDLEFTAWDNSMVQGWLAPGEFKEVVQIGAVKIDAVTLAEIDCLNILVRPRLNPVLSSYLENLTGITNARMSAEAVDFTPAYDRFVQFADGGVIVAFGRDDLVLQENLRLYGLHDMPPMPSYMNVSPWLRENGIDARGYHACDVARLCGAEFSGHEHDALDDARGVASGMRALVTQGARNLITAPKEGELL